MKKICFHINSILNCGGTEKVTIQIASLLLQNYSDYEVIILSSYGNSEILPFFKGHSKIVYKCLFNKKINFKINYLKMIKKLNEFLIKEKIDVLVGVDTILAVFDIPAVKNTSCKYIAWEHFNYNYNLGTKLRDLGRKLSVKKANAVVVLTDKDKEYFNSKLNVKVKLVRIYNPFAKEKKESKYNSNSNIILSSGRLTYQKGFDLLLDIANKLKQKNVDFKWLVLGEGEERTELEKKREMLSLKDCVEFIGNVKDVDKYYQQSKMFVFTSRFEGLGIVLLEAQANKLPIISFDCDCGPSEILKNNVNGYLIEKNDIDGMTDKIYKLLLDRKKCEFFSKNACLEVNKFLPEIIIEQWNSLIEELIKE